MNFSDLEKTSICAMLGNIINVDGHIDLSELICLERMRDHLNITDDLVIAAKCINAITIFDTIRNMSKEKKDVFMVLMVEMIEADGLVHHKEIELLGKVAVICKLV